jgi:hypothetical protein
MTKLTVVSRSEELANRWKWASILGGVLTAVFMVAGLKRGLDTRSEGWLFFSVVFLGGASCWLLLLPLGAGRRAFYQYVFNEPVQGTHAFADPKRTR